MAATLDLIEDGVEDVPRSRPRWLPIAISFVAGLGLGVITLAPDQQATIGDAPSSGSELESAPSLIGTAGAVPGFPDSVIAIAATENSALDRIYWPTRGEPVVRAMADGNNVVLSPNAEFVAFSSQVPGLEGSILSIGRFNLIRAISPGVTSYAWHDGENDLLSYTIENAGQTRLLTVNSTGLKDEIPWEGPPGATIASWGSWGWAIQSTPDQITLLAPDGNFKDTEPGRALASHSTGWILAMEGTEPKLVSAGGGVKRFATGSDFGIVAAAAFSPDGAKIAIFGSRGIAILARTSEEALFISDSSTSWASWSSDSRFLISSAATGFVSHDIEKGSSRTVLGNFAIIVARAVRGSS